MTKVLLSTLLCFASLSGKAQNQTYQSTIDQNLSIRSILVIPMADNVKGIYALPLSAKIIETLESDRRFEVKKALPEKTKPEVFENRPEMVLKLLKESQADALLTSRLSRGPKGISIQLALIGGQEGLPLVQEKIEDFNGFDIQDLQQKIDLMVKSLLQRLPYQAYVTSRRGQTVTLNAGSRHGLKVGDEVFVILISNIQRHPKFKFITRVDREIMGKIKIGKVDDSVSFGSLVTERSGNLIQPGFKVSWSEMTNYPEAGLTQNGDLIPQISERPESSALYGESPREWTGMQEGSFGKVSLLAGLTQTKLATSWSSGESPSSSNLFTPTVRLEGEMWLDPHWQANLVIEQLATKLTNDLSGSQPSSLNTQMQELSLLANYNILIEDDNFWGPKFQILGGFSKISVFVDDSSPRAFTSKDYSGLAVGLGGVIPLSSENKQRFLAGGKFLYFWSPSLHEAPTSSGSASNQLIHFNIFVEYVLSPRLSFRTDLNFKQAASTFNGGPGSSASSDFVGILGGAAFYF